MKLLRPVTAILLAIGVFGIVSLVGPGASASPAGHHHSVARKVSWQQYDKAVYVVSTLNAPLCSNGQLLSTVLVKHQKARLFTVLKSTIHANLYYVKVRKADRSLLGVYAYRMGWKLPAGIKGARCVRSVSKPGILSGYWKMDWTPIGWFHSTYPQN